MNAVLKITSLCVVTLVVTVGIPTEEGRILHGLTQFNTDNDTTADSQKKRAAPERFLIGPDGSTVCTLNYHWTIYLETSYWDQIEECRCDLCPVGRYVKSFCVCEQGTGVLKDNTVCVLAGIGQYMDRYNFCLEPYNCTTSCPQNQIMIKNCSRYVDIQCQCEQGWFNPNRQDTGNIPKECREKPSCPNPGKEPLENDSTDDDDTRTFSCQTCRDGRFKKEGDGSPGECKPRRVCQTKAGSPFEDNECLNDISSVSESPGTTATQESGSKSDAFSCVVAWSLFIVAAFCLVAAVCLIVWCDKDRKRWKELLRNRNDAEVNLQMLQDAGRRD